MLKFSIFNYPVEKNEIEELIKEEDIDEIIITLINKLMLRQIGGKYTTHSLIREFCYEKNRNKAGQLHENISKFYIGSRSSKVNPVLEEKIFSHLSICKDYGEIERGLNKYGEQLLFLGHVNLLKKIISDLENKIENSQKLNLLLGDIYTLQGSWNEAIDEYNLARKSDDKILKNDAEIKLSEIYIRRHDYQSAEVILQKTVENCVNIHYLKGESRCLNNLGIIQFKFYSELEKANQSLEKALSIGLEIKDDTETSDAYINIGNILIIQKKYNEAKVIFEKAKAIKEKQNDKSGIGICLNHLSKTCYLLGEDYYTEGTEYVKSALSIQEEIGDKLGIANSIVVYVECFMTESIQEGIDQCDRAHKIYEELGDEDGVARVENAYGLIFYNNNRFIDARNHFEKGILFYNSVNSYSELIYLHYNLAITFAKNNIECISRLKHFISAFCCFKKIKLDDPLNIISQIEDIKTFLGQSKYEKAVIEIIKDLKEELKEYYSPFVYKLYERNDRFEIKLKDGSTKIVKYKDLPKLDAGYEIIKEIEK